MKKILLALVPRILLFHKTAPLTPKLTPKLA